MILALEGCDAVGKDTFANILSEKIGYEIIRGSSFEISELGADGMFEYTMELLDRDNIILNRTFFSNLVYGELYNYPMMTQKQYDDLVDKIDENTITIYLYASSGTIKYRMSNRGDDMIKQDEVDNILNKYNEVMYGDFRPKMMLSIDTTSTNFESEIKLIEKMVK